MSDTSKFFGGFCKSEVAAYREFKRHIQCVYDFGGVRDGGVCESKDRPGEYRWWIEVKIGSLGEQALTKYVLTEYVEWGNRYKSDAQVTCPNCKHEFGLVAVNQ